MLHLRGQARSTRHSETRKIGQVGCKTRNGSRQAVREVNGTAYWVRARFSIRLSWI